MSPEIWRTPWVWLAPTREIRRCERGIPPLNSHGKKRYRVAKKGFAQNNRFKKGETSEYLLRRLSPCDGVTFVTPTLYVWHVNAHWEREWLRSTRLVKNISTYVTQGCKASLRRSAAAASKRAGMSLGSIESFIEVVRSPPAKSLK